MSAIRGTFLNGGIVPDVSPPWADGTRLDLEPREESGPVDEEVSSPEEIARLLALMDSLEPVMSEEEALEWERQRREQKEKELADWDNQARKIGKLFQ